MPRVTATPDAHDLVALRAAWARRHPDADRRMVEIAQRAAAKVVWRYPVAEYGFVAASTDEVATDFASWLLTGPSRGRVSRLLDRATTLPGVEYELFPMIRQWLVARFRQTRAGKLLRRVRHLAEPASKAAFDWVERLRWMARTGGSRTPREGDRKALARAASSAPAVRELMAEAQDRDHLRMRPFRTGAAAIVDAHGAAIRDLLLTDVILDLTGADTRPAIVRESVAEPPWLRDVGVHEAAVALHQGLLRRLGIGSAELDARYAHRHAGGTDAALDHAMAAEIVALELQPDDRAPVLQAFGYVLEAQRPPDFAEDEEDDQGDATVLDAGAGG